MKFTSIKQTIFKWTNPTKSSDPSVAPHTAVGVGAPLAVWCCSSMWRSSLSCPPFCLKWWEIWKWSSPQGLHPLCLISDYPCSDSEVEVPVLGYRGPNSSEDLSHWDGFKHHLGHLPLPEPATLLPSCPKESITPLCIYFHPTLHSDQKITSIPFWQLIRKKVQPLGLHPHPPKNPPYFIFNLRKYK